jgi:hypothetical protein
LPRRSRKSSPPLSPPSIGNLDSPSPPPSDVSYHDSPRQALLEDQPDQLDDPRPLNLSAIG